METSSIHPVQAEAFASICTKCDINIEGKVTSCPKCGNKAYIKHIPISKNGIVVTAENKEALERHCKTKIPDDVVCVIPSILCFKVGAKEEMELAEERRKNTLKKTERKKNGRLPNNRKRTSLPSKRAVSV
jgi:hypothetical protein